MNITKPEIVHYAQICFRNKVTFSPEFFKFVADEIELREEQISSYARNHIKEFVCLTGKDNSFDGMYAVVEDWMTAYVFAQQIIDLTEHMVEEIDCYHGITTSRKVLFCGLKDQLQKATFKKVPYKFVVLPEEQGNECIQQERASWDECFSDPDQSEIPPWDEYLCEYNQYKAYEAI